MTGFDAQYQVQAPPVVTIKGDQVRGARLRGRALQLLRITKEQNFQHLPVWQMTFHQDPLTGAKAEAGPGTDVFVCSVIFGQPQVEIHAASEDEARAGEASAASDAPLSPGQFYHIPGCVARYDFKGSLENAVPFTEGDQEEGAGNTNSGSWTSVFSFPEAGLRALRGSPGGVIRRDFHVFRLDGGSVDADEDAMSLSMSRTNMPGTGPFSVSCVARLNEEIVMDYTFTEKTEELASGFEIFNPIRPKVLRSEDGERWYAECPGSIAPVVAYLAPDRLSTHWSLITFPWPPFNSNFLSSWGQQIGFREIVENCPGEPLLTHGDKMSPYWDQVTPGSLDVLDGTFENFWEENAEIRNAGCYFSYCTFRVPGSHVKAVGTRVAGTCPDGSRRYARVFARIYDTVSDTTLFTLQDYQHRKYVNHAVPSLEFGTQQFPVVHPNGYLTGMIFQGLCWYNGNRILAGKLCDLEADYKNDLLVTGPLDVGSWYFMCLAHDDDASTLYYSKFGSGTMHVVSGRQSASAFPFSDDLGDETKVHVGSAAWRMAVSGNDDDVRSAWDFSSKTDVGALRFFHRAVRQAEVTLLCQEAFGAAFVADGFEADILEQYGYQRVTI